MSKLGETVEVKGVFVPDILIRLLVFPSPLYSSSYLTSSSSSSQTKVKTAYKRYFAGSTNATVVRPRLGIYLSSGTDHAISSLGALGEFILLVPS